MPTVWRRAGLALALALIPVALQAQRTAAPPLPLPQNGAEQAPPSATPPPVAPAPAPPTTPNPEDIPGQQLRPAPPPAPPTYDPAAAKHDLDVGNFYYNRGDYVGALARFQDAVAHDKGLTAALYRAGETELKLRQIQPARSYWQQYLDADPTGHYANDARRELKKHPAPAPPPRAGSAPEPKPTSGTRA